VPQATVLYFAAIGELLQRERETCELPGSASADEILACLAARHPPAAALLGACRVAVDCEFIATRVQLRGGEEVAVIPPVSGG
jgi:molybdopterin converting factor subunit 1